ncbi:hypothetical protein BD779DRAFT_1562580, partial [Infundibulicybe gibba]
IKVLEALISGLPLCPHRPQRAQKDKSLQPYCPTRIRIVNPKRKDMLVRPDRNQVMAPIDSQTGRPT